MQEVLHLLRRRDLSFFILVSTAPVFDNLCEQVNANGFSVLLLLYTLQHLLFRFCMYVSTGLVDPQEIRDIFLCLVISNQK